MRSHNNRLLRELILVRLPQLGKCFSVLLCILLLGAVAYVDYLTTYEISVSVLYLFPIFLSTITNGLRAGLLMSLASVVSRMTTDALSGDPSGSLLTVAVNAFVSFLVFSCFVYLLCELHESYLEESLASRTDELTGIANRKMFYEVAAQELERCRRFGKPLNLLIIDADDFKTLNDTRGHLTGDKALKAMADTIRNNVRRIDLVARLGGDEFAVLLPEIGQEETMTVADKLHAKLLETMRDGGWPLTCSIGAVSCQDQDASLETILHKADMAMYESKRRGKDRVTEEDVC